MELKVNMNEYLPLRDVVYNTLRQAILRGELKPGERLMEIQLANKLGVSRTPIREAIQAFIESTQKYVTGEVKFKLYKGNIIKAGTTSPYTLYNASIASFTTGDLYDHHDAEGFINLFGLSCQVRAMKMAQQKETMF